MNCTIKNWSSGYKKLQKLTQQSTEKLKNVNFVSFIPPFTLYYIKFIIILFSNGYVIYYVKCPQDHGILKK